MKVCYFVDGFNLYHAIKAQKHLQKYKWLNLRRLAELFLKSDDKLQKVYYFSALATWNQDKMKKHRVYIEALKSMGVEIILGEFRRKEVKCLAACRKIFKTHEEKETDVNIAVKIFQSAVREEFDKAFIISGDSDLIPAIRGVQEIFPTKEFGIIVPIGRQAELLKQVANFHMKLKEKHLAAAQFPDQITIGNKILTRPPNWK